jgi:hypothetical protein
VQPSLEKEGQHQHGNRDRTQNFARPKSGRTARNRRREGNQRRKDYDAAPGQKATNS